MRLAVVADEAVFPTNSGGRRLVLNETSGLRPLVDHLSLFVFHREPMSFEDVERHRALADDVVFVRRDTVGRSLILHPTLSYQFASRLPPRSWRSSSEVDAVIAHHEWCVPLARHIGQGLPVFLRSHNDERRFLREMARSSSLPRRPYLWREQVLCSERRLRRAAAAANEVWLVSPEDAFIYDGLSRELIPPALMIDSSRPVVDLAPPSQSIVFLGALDISHNVDGLLWFNREVMPKVAEVVRSVRLVVAGRRPSAGLEHQLHTSPRVDFLGEVHDPITVLKQGRIAINPALTGSGINMKCGDALGAGRPLVSTLFGSRGLEDLFGDKYRPTDDARSLARHCVELLTDDRAWVEETQRQASAVTNYSAAAVAAKMRSRLDFVRAR